MGGMQEYPFSVNVASVLWIIARRKRACIVLLLLNHFHIKYYGFAITYYPME